MTRRRGASHKKPRRPRPRSTAAVDGDDDRDIDYVAGEEDEQSAGGTDGEDASTRGSTGEESFQFNGSGESSDEEVAATKPKRKGRAKVANRDGESAAGSRRRSRNLDFIVDVGDDEGDEDFAPEDELEIVSPISGKKRKSKASSTGRKRRKPTGVAAAKKRCRKPSASDDDEDFELDGRADKTSIKASGKRTVPPRRAKEISGSICFDFVCSDDDEDFELEGQEDKKSRSTSVKSTAPRRAKKKSGSANFNFGGSDDDEDFELEGKVDKKRKMTSGKKTAPPRSAKKKSGSADSDFVVSDGDEDFELEDEADKKSKGSSGKRTAPRSSKKKSGTADSDFVVSDGDEDFELEDEADKKSKRSSGKRTAPRSSKKKSGSADSDFVVSDGDEDFELEDEADKKSKRCSGKRTAPRSSKKKSGSADSDFVVSDSDEDFELEDEADKKSKRSSGKRMAPRRANKRSGLVDSDFVASDDDFVLEGENCVTATRKKRTAAVKARRRSVRIDVSESSDSSDSDYVVSEEEVGDLDDGGVAGKAKAKAKIGLKSKGLEKGKEKEDHVAEKGNCSICLCDEQKGTIRGVLDCCVHFFCYACIIMWSKMDTHCPYCKQRFRTITQSGLGLSKPITVRVKERDQVYQPSEEELREWMDHYENAVCIICAQGGDDDLMLLCDICDSPAHTYCTGLGREVPEGNWYCDVCRSPRQGSPNPPVQEAAIDLRPSSNDLLCGGAETEDLSTINATTDIHKSPSFPGQSSAQSIDLNVSPEHISDEDHGTHQSGDILPGSPNLHVQDTAVDQGISNSNLSGVTSSSNLSGIIRNVDLRTNMLAGKVVSLPGRSSSRKTITLFGSSNSQVQDKGTSTSSSNLSGVKRTEGLHINTNARKALFLSGQSSSQSGCSPIRPSNLQVQNNMVDQGIDSSNLPDVINEDLRRIMNAGKAVSFPEQSPSQSGHILSGSSNFQVQDTAVNKGSNSDFLTNMHVTKGPLTGLSCSQRIDLNLSPGHILGEDHGVSTQSSGAVASTISGRRHIHKRICILLSNNRPMQTNGTTESSRRCVERDVMIPEAEQGLDQQNCRPVSQSTTSLDPHILSEENSIRRLDRAKEQVLLMVKNHLKEIGLAEEREAFKEIARRSTHTILAACGMKHRGRLVAAVVHPPENCSHDSSNELINLVEGCCLSCFNSFVSDVIRKVMDSIKMAKENAAASSEGLLGTK